MRASNGFCIGGTGAAWPRWSASGKGGAQFGTHRKEEIVFLTDICSFLCDGGGNHGIESVACPKTQPPRV
jgi:hypothetical protein